MSFVSSDYRVAEGKVLKLEEWPTNVETLYASKADYKKLLKTQVKELSKQQRLHYADNRYALLLIFQGMDAAGKDSAIRHVMSGVNPQGCQVYSFKQPSLQELEHDFLWRTEQCLPERGHIGIFNRSYYEEVLIVRVHPELLQRQNLPRDLHDGDALWQQRYESICGLESHLHHNGTRVIKFFLHLSREEQRKRFIARIDEPAKNWKFSQADIEERKFWDQYMQAYQQCISATSTEHAPWYIVPADDKDNARLIISKIILETFDSLKMEYPVTDEKHQAELQKIRKALENEAKQ